MNSENFRALPKMSRPMTLVELEKTFPDIQWRRPILVKYGDDPSEHFACRVCIAHNGLTAEQVPDLPTDPAIVKLHIRRTHL